MIKLEENFDGHIILYCKGHYTAKDVDFISGLQRIWAVRCGLQIEHISDNIKEYIADHLHTIFVKCNPKKQEYFYQILNKGLCDEWKYEGLNAIERVIMIYSNELGQLQIKNRTASGWHTLIKLPKPQKRLFKRIVNGKGNYNDYKLVR